MSVSAESDTRVQDNVQDVLNESSGDQPSFADALRGKPPPVWPIKTSPKQHTSSTVRGGYIKADILCDEVAHNVPQQLVLQEGREGEREEEEEERKRGRRCLHFKRPSLKLSSQLRSQPCKVSHTPLLSPDHF